ncbi:hypothetical protein ARMGADRAFT_1031909 [Armillaria gallica]|uniref:Uncharacterized protein n=1 Tax=Armillaria gallica TaxID=47427 RepID=A0A2H3DUV8_ARMGA|nr:hypothetical protein ARMGADRAFT_1031909 [Armillaria gallica]
MDALGKADRELILVFSQVPVWAQHALPPTLPMGVPSDGPFVSIADDPFRFRGVGHVFEGKPLLLRELGAFRRVGEASLGCLEIKGVILNKFEDLEGSIEVFIVSRSSVEEVQIILVRTSSFEGLMPVWCIWRSRQSCRAMGMSGISGVG